MITMYMHALQQRERERERERERRGEGGERKRDREREKEGYHVLLLPSLEFPVQFSSLTALGSRVAT